MCLRPDIRRSCLSSILVVDRKSTQEDTNGGTELRDLSAPDIAPDIDEHGIHGQVIIIEQIKGVTFKQFEGAPLAPITPAAMLGVFLSLTLATLALMCSKWDCYCCVV